MIRRIPPGSKRARESTVSKGLKSENRIVPREESNYSKNTRPQKTASYLEIFKIYNLATKKKKEENYFQ